MTAKATPKTKPAPKKVAARATSSVMEALILSGKSLSDNQFDALMACVRDDERKTETRLWHNAMRACQAEIGHISKDASNSQTRSKYVTLGALDAALRPFYLKHGFDCTFDSRPGRSEDEIHVILSVTHEGGHCKTFEIDVPVDGMGTAGRRIMTRVHSAASGITYGRRYLLTMAFNIATVDDDGNGAGSVPKEGTEAVSAQQAKHLRQLADRAGGKEALICAFLSKKHNEKIDTFEALPKTLYEPLVEQFTAKIEELKGADKQGPQGQ